MLLQTSPVPACGPFAPDRLLDNGGDGMMSAPMTSFILEIQAMNLIPATHVAVPATNGFNAQTADADVADLKSALARLGREEHETRRIVNEYTDCRETIRQYAEERQAWTDRQKPWLTANTNPPPPFPTNKVSVPDGLPPEFNEYLRGAIAWHAGRTNEACDNWKRLLNSDPKERAFRSTWAAFMLGRATWETEPRRAVNHFRKVREFAGAGFHDTLGLANSSLGWEARVELRRDHFSKAIDLYLEQAAGGDVSAYNSLRFTASKALHEGRSSLKTLASNPRAQKVITAHLISRGRHEPRIDVDVPAKEVILNALAKQTLVKLPVMGWHRYELPAILWLRAVESAGVKDVESAGKLALAAYQNDEMDIAWRWVRRSAESPASQWLKAKLLLRDAKVDEAATILSQLCGQFPISDENAPVDPTRGDQDIGSRLINRLGILDSFYSEIPASTRMLGELGGLRVSRREYIEALDALLRSGFEEDATYVADRVLTLDELRRYVNRCWPAVQGDESSRTRTMRFHVRHLLATRLLRLGHREESLEYFDEAPAQLVRQYIAALSTGSDPALSIEERASVLWQAAQSAFSGGYRVFTPPAETDWNTRAGLFNMYDTPPARVLPAPTWYLPLSTDERQRVTGTSMFPERNWYYRFIAADLGWEAARLMPENSDETARVLWQAGTWIKYADPKLADRFYKALVNRCRNTELGDAADKRRWFPFPDENGKPILNRQAEKSTEPAPGIDE